jgi:ribosome-binding protein aMBF1 (putative translation factor)
VEDFGFAVRHARTAAGLPRAQLAKQSGIAEATLRRIELARHRCTGRNRTKLIQALTDLLTSPSVATP